MSKVAAVIPARGGSQGLPRKNVLDLCGKPLIAWNIEAALAASAIDRVFVTTDDPEIARVSQEYGAEVIMRPAELATSEASSEAALLHCIAQMQTVHDYHPDHICFLQCTSPLTHADDIDATVEKCTVDGADSALAVSDFHYFVWRTDEDGQTVGVNHQSDKRLRRQDRQPEYLESGAVYVFSTTGFTAHEHRFFGKIAMYNMPSERVHEIDDRADLELAETRLQALLDKNRKTGLPDNMRAVIMDFDGVFTDDCVTVDQNGVESVRCSRRDGMGIEMLRKAGLQLVVISKEKNPVVLRRCEKLQIECYHGIDDKITLLQQWLEKNSISSGEAIYVGNDINDVACMNYCGFAVCPGDGHGSAKQAADLTLSLSGGKGALRELADLLLG